MPALQKPAAAENALRPEQMPPNHPNRGGAIPGMAKTAVLQIVVFKLVCYID
ncbi:hypothetical protein [Neisseria dentiae]|uniref:hypothetical protein n=1 Tax=Neisseria dentiae TaxID=194197 RepID=UPI00359FD061